MKLILVVIVLLLLVASLPEILPTMLRELLKPFKLEKFAFSLSSHVAALVSLLLSYTCFVLGASNFLIGASAYLSCTTWVLGALSFLVEFLPRFKVYMHERYTNRYVAALSSIAACIILCFFYFTVIVLVGAYWADKFLGIEGTFEKVTTFLLEN